MNNKILLDFRQKMGYSQMTMAAKLGVSMNTYILWERGISTPNDANQIMITELLKKEGK